MTTLLNVLSPNAGYQHPFVDGTTYLFGVGDEPRTLCELAMTRLSAELRSICGWWDLLGDEATRQRWTEEAVNKTWRVGPLANNIQVGLTRHQIDYVLDELAGYANLREETSGIQVCCFDRIWESDTLLEDAQQKAIQECLVLLRALLAKPSESKPMPDVLVDPLRHSCISGRTFLQTWRGVELHVDHREDDYCYSSKFSVLPTVVRVHPDGSHVEYQTYVNGIDPVQSEIYGVLQNILGCCIYLFERVLSSLHRSNPLPQRIQGSYRYTVWDEPEPPEESDDDEAWEQHLRDVRQWALYRPIEIPDVPSEGYKCELLRMGHNVSLRGRQIQVIHRVVDIHLDSRRQEVADTHWRVVGMKNEQIVACCLHFVNVRGIENGRLDFRMAVTSPSHFVPHDVGATLRTWGLQSGDACNHFLGSVPLRSGLTVAFPNIYQHRMRGVKLQEGHDEGQLTIIEFYLVDPDVPPITSTADVAPQQRDWVYRALAGSVDRRLPPEVLERIVDMVESVLSEEEAERYRTEMLKEREDFAQVHDEKYYSLPFDLDVVEELPY
ncbi:hypothetical protein M0805_008916 [Coniferiporia weirii]|nr:hypothetical protein M0805_008916 [Coniferiporia weirii]